MKHLKWLLLSLALCLSSVAMAAPVAESWRPEPVGTIIKNDSFYSPVVRAAENVVIAGDSAAKTTRFDLRTGARRLRLLEGVTKDGKSLWKLNKIKPARLEIVRGVTQQAYVLPTELLEMFKEPNPEFFEVSDTADRVELWADYRFCRWNKTTGKLEHTTQFAGFSGNVGQATLTPDGSAVIEASINRTGQTCEIVRWLTSDGSQGKTIELPALRGADAARVSPGGNFALFQLWTAEDEEDWRIVDANSGRALWKFKQNGGETVFAISSDEKWIAIRQGAARVWEIRDLATGKLVRTLPLLFAANAATFSPDSGALYCISGGVLYRQRAR